MLPLYRSLLHLYPAAYRCEYGEEMMAVLSEVQAEIERKGVFARVMFGACEIGGLLHGALQEHLRSITGFYGGEMFSPRRFTMRSEFRFPKATVTLMSIIFVAILVAMDRAKAIQDSVIPYASPHVGPLRPLDLTVLPSLLMVLVGACGAAAIGWAILYALRRSGVQRLSELGPADSRRSGSGLTS